MSAGTSWGNSTGFGANTSNSGGAQPISGGLFGNSSSALPTFGAKSQGASLPANTQQNANTGLFGNSSNNALTTLPGLTSSGLFGSSANNTSNNGGLFGNTGSKPTTGGLFGNTNSSSAAAGGGLFGNTNSSSSTTGGGLFGTSASNPTSNTGTSNTSGGLFGNSNKPATGGLFGSSNSTANTGGLFGNPNTTATGNSNSTAAGGLFGNSNSTATTGGLFGASTNPLNKPSTGGLFGSSNTGGMFGASGNTGGLFGASNASNTNAQGPNIASTAYTPNPYSSDSILSSINATENNMPLSITGSLFAKPSSIQHRQSTLQPPKKTYQLSLLKRLAQTFKIFRSTPDSSIEDLGKSHLKGIFTQQNFVGGYSNSNVDTSSYSVSKNQKKTSTLPVANVSVGDVKKLVIKSKPLKFHLINADKVFNAKKRCILVLSINGGLATHQNPEESDLEDTEFVEQEHRKVAKNVSKIQVEAEEAEKSELDDMDTNNGYWCSPSLAYLSKLSPSELSHVENFIVGRLNVGQIAYNFPVDLAGLFALCADRDVPVSQELFGKIIKIDGSIVKVYSEEEEMNCKPGIGFELNVPATITIKAPPKKNISDQDHIRRLQNLTGMEFVTYNPLTHYWTFKVKHFSIWGLIDDGEDDDMVTDDAKKLLALKKKQDDQEPEASATYSQIYENEAYQRELKRQRIGNYTSGLPGAWDHTANLVAGGLLGVKQELVQNEIDRELREYKQDKSTDAWAMNLSDITSEGDESEDAKSLNSIALQNPLYPEEAKNYDYLKQIVSVMPPNTDMEEIVNERAYEPEVSNEADFDQFGVQSSLPTSKDWLLQLELANDIDSALNPYLAIPYKKQLALSTVKDIVFSDFEKSKESKNNSRKPLKDESNLISEVSSTAYDNSAVTKLVQKLLVRSTVSKRENSFPRLQLDKSLDFRAISFLNGHDTDSQLIELASILFDEVDISSNAKYQAVDLSNKSIKHRLETLEQRNSFISWLKKYKLGSSSDIQGDSLDIIYDTICRGNLKSAVELAISSHNTHLAALLTLLDSNDQAVKKIAQSQIEDWKVTGAIEFIPAPIIKIHKILAGAFDEVSQDIPYHVAIALRLLYGNPVANLLSVLSSVNCEDISDDFTTIIDIYSKFNYDGFKEATARIEKSELSDKVKWLSLQVLSNKTDNLDSSSNDSVSNLFAKSLEESGFWKEAIFVYSSVHDDSSVEQLIRRVVISNINEIKNDERDNEEFSVSVLGVPRSLIHEAIAIEKSKNGDYWGQVEALVEAQLWEKAHVVICKELGPETVISNSELGKSRLQALADMFHEKGAIIPEWNQGAGLYVKYFESIDAFERHSDIATDDLNFLLCNLALVQVDSFMSQVALKIMTKKVGDVTLDHKQQVPDVKRKIHALIMGENERNYFESRLQGLNIR